MAILCGVDIIEIKRIRHSFETLGDSFRDRIFTNNEINYCESRNIARFESYAARFAAKEAISKAFGTGIGKGINLSDMEIINDNHGKPYVVFYNRAKEIYREIMGKSISISLSHCKQYAVAYVVIEV